MPSTINVSTNLTPDPTSVVHDTAEPTFKNQVQNSIDAVNREDTLDSHKPTLTTDVVLKIMHYLNPPVMKDFQVKYKDTPGQFKELCDYTLRQDVFWHTYSLPRPINSPTKIKPEQAWFAAFREMPQPMQTMYADANLSFDVFNAFDPEDADHMHKAAIAVCRAVEKITLNLLPNTKKITLNLLPNANKLISPATKEIIAKAELLAERAGRTLPACAYESVMAEYVEVALGYVFWARPPIVNIFIAEAEYFAGKAGREALPTEAYESLMNKWAKKIIFFTWVPDCLDIVEESIAEAKNCAKKAGCELPEFKLPPLRLAD